MMPNITKKMHKVVTATNVVFGDKMEKVKKQM